MTTSERSDDFVYVIPQQRIGRRSRIPSLGTSALFVRKTRDSSGRSPYCATTHSPATASAAPHPVPSIPDRRQPPPNGHSPARDHATDLFGRHALTSADGICLRQTCAKRSSVAVVSRSRNASFSVASIRAAHTSPITNTDAVRRRLDTRLATAAARPSVYPFVRTLFQFNHFAASLTKFLSATSPACSRLMLHARMSPMRR